MVVLLLNLVLLLVVLQLILLRVQLGKDNQNALADAAAEVEAAEGEIARKEAVLVRSGTEASLRRAAPPASN